MNFVVKDYFKSFDRSVKAHMFRNLKDAAQYYLDELRLLLSTQGPPRSTPYTEPHMEFGRLIAAYAAEYDRPTLTARVGAGMIRRESGGSAPYGRYLEYGTSRMRMRPHIRPALFDNMLGIGVRIVWPMS